MDFSTKIRALVQNFYLGLPFVPLITALLIQQLQNILHSFISHTQFIRRWDQLSIPSNLAGQITLRLWTYLQCCPQDVLWKGGIDHLLLILPSHGKEGSKTYINQWQGFMIIQTSSNGGTDLCKGGAPNERHRGQPWYLLGYFLSVFVSPKSWIQKGTNHY